MEKVDVEKEKFRQFAGIVAMHALLSKDYLSYEEISKSSKIIADHMVIDFLPEGDDDD